MGFCVKIIYKFATLTYHLTASNTWETKQIRLFAVSPKQTISGPAFLFFLLLIFTQRMIS